MTTPGYPGAVPDPEANRAQWQADHPGAAPVTAQQAQDATDPGTLEGVPSTLPTGEDMVAAQQAAGVAGPLPYEEQMNAAMEQIRLLAGEVERLQQRDIQRTVALQAQLGPPPLEGYSQYIVDALKAHQAANPALGSAHYGQAVDNAEQLVKAAHAAIGGGGNDLGRVRYYAGQLDRFLSRTHPRAKGAYSNPDHSAVEQALEYVIDEADRLTGHELATIG
jgi:hypothetical protein